MIIIWVYIITLFYILKCIYCIYLSITGDDIIIPMNIVYYTHYYVIIIII